MMIEGVDCTNKSMKDQEYCALKNGDDVADSPSIVSTSSMTSSDTFNSNFEEINGSSIPNGGDSEFVRRKVQSNLQIEKQSSDIIYTTENTGCGTQQPKTTKPPVLLFGYDISKYNRRNQFVLCFMSMMGFTVIYGCLQELIAVKVASRRLPLFLATIQFAGYASWSFLLSNFSDIQSGKKTAPPRKQQKGVPIHFYIFLSLLRSVDVSMSNLSMQFLNYPAKTLIKSSRVVFTMVLGVLIGRKRYSLLDYITVSLIVLGLVIFLNADQKGNVMFRPEGVLLLVTSLICDGAINNYSEIAMNKFEVGQDHFLSKLYSIALIAMLSVAHIKGELMEGLQFITTPGTWEEINQGLEPSWSITQKICVLVTFSTFGLFGSSCAAAITKNFGALTMSISSTARKAMTLFLSFLIFQNECTFQHVGGMVIFLSALTLKSLRTRKKNTVEPEKLVGDSLLVVTKTSSRRSKLLNARETSSISTTSGRIRKSLSDEVDSDDDSEDEVATGLLMISPTYPQSQNDLNLKIV